MVLHGKDVPYSGKLFKWLCGWVFGKERCMKPIVGYLVSAYELIGYVIYLTRKVFASSGESQLCHH
jgi:hypothetical protein